MEIEIKPGDFIYVPSDPHSVGVEKYNFVGGQAEISRVEFCDDSKKHRVILKNMDGVSFYWEDIKNRQEEFAAFYGKEERAYIDYNF